MKFVFILFFIFLFSCGNYKEEEDIDIKASKEEVTSGEILDLTYTPNKDYNTVETYLVDQNYDIIDYYGLQKNTGFIRINRFLLNSNTTLNQSHSLKIVFKSEEDNITYNFPININSSLVIDYICATESCNSLTGNIVEKVKNKMKVTVLGIRAKRYTYYISTLDNIYESVHEYSLPVNVDYLENIIFDSVPSKSSSYIVSIRVIAEDLEGEFVETAIPLRVVRPIEVKHYGKYELAEVYEPIPVSGCIIGSVGNRVNYSESTSETRQNSVNVVINKSWTDSNSVNISESSSDGLSIGETNSVVNSSSLSSSETNSENQTIVYSESDSNNSSFSTSDGENWQWSLNESSTEGTSSSNSNSTSIGANGSVTVGVSGEGSLPFLAKASGKVETTVGVSASNTGTESSAVSNSQSTGRVYSTAGSKNKSASYGTAQNITNTSSLSGAYAVSNSNSSSISQGNSESSSRVWNMSKSIGSGKVTTYGDSESLGETIVKSESSTTTFSYSGYIARGRSGIFYRQTSRWTKLSEIISYDLNGFPNHAGYISMNSWSWAPELATGESCKEIPQPLMESATCYIQPCGE